MPEVHPICSLNCPVLEVEVRRQTGGNFFVADLGGESRAVAIAGFIFCLSVTFRHAAKPTVQVIAVMLSYWSKAFWALLLLASVAQAQFQFFEHMFGGGGPGQGREQQAPQDGPSDPSWYQNKWENGKIESV